MGFGDSGLWFRGPHADVLSLSGVVVLVADVHGVWWFCGKGGRACGGCTYGFCRASRTACRRVHVKTTLVLCTCYVGTT